MIELFPIRDDRPTVECLLGINGKRQLLYPKTLRSGLSICATASQSDCGPVSMDMPDAPEVPGAVFGRMSFPDQDDRGTGRPFRMILMPGKDLLPTVWELGGCSIA